MNSEAISLCNDMKKSLMALGWQCFSNKFDKTQFRVFIGTAPITQKEIKQLRTVYKITPRRWYLCFYYPSKHANDNLFETMIMNPDDHYMSIPEAGYKYIRSFLNYPALAHKELLRVCEWIDNNQDKLNSYHINLF